MSTLPELVQEHQILFNQISDAGGELTPEIEKALDEIKFALSTKSDSYAFMIKKFESEAEFYKTEAGIYSDYGRRLSRMADAMKTRIKYAMIEMNEKEIGSFQLRNTKAIVRIVLEDEIPEEYQKKEIIITPDKKKIEEALKSGIVLTFAHLESNVALYITPKKQKEITNGK